ncbi:MAG: hypothetical protein OXT72_05455 [Gammaproteobacteria bacterium]|nr:hypothetical protein [Gammaproteobacteria bacterium]MDE0247800.1 hypothetical protein [Gammaproteobacteria bacterium]
MNVSSGAQTPTDFNDPMLGEKYTASRAYAQSKPARILFTLDLAEDLADRGIRVNALHPATLTGTNIALSAGVRAWSPVEEGFAAETRPTAPQDVGTGG